MGKTYFNTFLAMYGSTLMLNSREYLFEKLEQTTISAPTNNLSVFRPTFVPHNLETTGQTSTAGGEYEVARVDDIQSGGDKGTAKSYIQA